MKLHKNYFSKGILIGFLAAMFVELALLGVNIYGCREVSGSHPEAYFATRVEGVSGSYCQVISSESQKKFADNQRSLFSPSPTINNSSNSLGSFVFFQALHFASLALVAMLIGATIGFFIEKEI